MNEEKYQLGLTDTSITTYPPFQNRDIPDSLEMINGQQS